MPTINHPNILVCLFDSLSASDYELLLSSRNSGALQDLSKHSVLFSRAYSPNPESSPARASLLTGLDPSVHGLWTNGVKLPEHELTFAQRLNKAGYNNFLAGRYQLSGVSRWTTEYCRPFEFNQMKWAHGPLHRSRQNEYLLWLKRNAADTYARLFSTQANPENTSITDQQRSVMETLPDDLSFNNWVGESIIEWTKSQPNDEPFLAIAGFSVGDSFGAEPNSDFDGEDLFQPALQQADAAINKLVQLLKVSKRLDDTTIVVTSARGNVTTQSFNCPLADRSVRVPLMISSSKLTQNIIEEPVSTLDVAPTLLDLANVPAGSRIQGQSLRHLSNGQSTSRGWALCRLRTNSLNGENNWQSALYADGMKLIIKHESDANYQTSLSLYKLDSDPHEEINLAGLDTHSLDLENMIDQMIDARCAMEDRTEPRIAEF